MDADPTYLGPGTYGLLWPVLGGLLLLALLVWAGLIYLSTRPPEEPRRAPMPPDAVTRIRLAALGRIDEVEQQVHSGGLSARGGHHELSLVVRGFAAEVAGLDADRMTAADLRARGPEHLARLIEEYYPRQFGAAESEPPTIDASARAAREVVSGWT